MKLILLCIALIWQLNPLIAAERQSNNRGSAQAGTFREGWLPYFGASKPRATSASSLSAAAPSKPPLKKQPSLDLISYSMKSSSKSIRQQLQSEKPDEHKRSRLMLAARLKEAGLVLQFLLQADNPAAVDAQGNNVIAYAAAVGDMATIRTVIQYMSRPDKILVKNTKGQTAYDIAKAWQPTAYDVAQPASPSAKSVQYQAIIDLLDVYKQQLKN